MTTKQKLIEIAWTMLSCLIAFIFLATILAPFDKSSFYISDIYAGFQPNTSTELTDYFNPINFGLSVFLAVPTLFIINTIRETIKKFSRRPNNVLLLIITSISIFLTSLLAYFFKIIITLLFGSVTIYPPLSALPEMQSTPEWTDAGSFFLIGFIACEVFVLIFTIRQIVKTK